MRGTRGWHGVGMKHPWRPVPGGCPVPARGAASQVRGLTGVCLGDLAFLSMARATPACGAGAEHGLPGSPGENQLLPRGAGPHWGWLTAGSRLPRRREEMCGGKRRRGRLWEMLLAGRGSSEAGWSLLCSVDSGTGATQTLLILALRSRQASLPGARMCLRSPG